MDILLIQPPALKPAEPPLGLAVLLAHLRAQGLRAEALDANLGATLYLLDPDRLAALAGPEPDTSTRRALRHLPGSLALLRSPRGGASFARYETAVRYLNRLLALWGGPGGGERLTLGDYQHDTLSPFDPGDLERLGRGEARTLFSDYFRDEVLPRVEASRPKIVALSVNYLHQALPAFELAGMLRRVLPEATLVAGGGLVTSWQEPLRRLDLRLEPFDRIVFGPGESPLGALASGHAGEDYFLEDSASIGFAPDFSFAVLGDYLSPEPVLPLSASRGCYWKRCLFCPEAAAPVHPYAATRPEDFPDLLLLLAAEHGVRHFHLTDNAVPVNVLRGMAARSEELRGLSWHGFVRFEDAFEDPGFFGRLAESGCRMLQLGLESGSQTVLDRLGKGIRLEAAARILTNLREAGIAAYVYIMLGTPGEREADAERTLAFLEEHADRIGFLNLSIMNLPRSSGLLDNPELYGISDWAEIDEANPLRLYREFSSVDGWDRAAARRFLDRRLLGSPVVRAIVNRTPPLFTSNHAFFFGGGAV
ncbi:radical SAM protein [Desulfuromonas sp.]|uniref:B12-binding domain-containing radical SAM protein n=1 Tax=Desulfuromonas sp. TaxID=892 RepID=UPI0025C4EC21|nr:radical SAM protein [Desulfuromonas sp.]